MRLDIFPYLVLTVSRNYFRKTIRVLSRLNSAFWVIFHIFCRLLIISKSTFLKNSFGNTIRVSNSLDSDQADFLSGLIWVQTVGKDYQQMTLLL